MADIYLSGLLKMRNIVAWLGTAGSIVSGAPILRIPVS